MTPDQVQRMAALESEITTNSERFKAGKDLTAKLYVKGRMIGEAITDVTIEADRRFLIGYIAALLAVGEGRGDGAGGGGTKGGEG